MDGKISFSTTMLDRRDKKLRPPNRKLTGKGGITAFEQTDHKGRQLSKSKQGRTRETIYYRRHLRGVNFEDSVTKSCAHRRTRGEKRPQNRQVLPLTIARRKTDDPEVKLVKKRKRDLSMIMTEMSTDDPLEVKIVKKSRKHNLLMLNAVKSGHFLYRNACSFQKKRPNQNDDDDDVDGDDGDRNNDRNNDASKKTMNLNEDGTPTTKPRNKRSHNKDDDDYDDDDNVENIHDESSSTTNINIPTTTTTTTTTNKDDFHHATTSPPPPPPPSSINSNNNANQKDVDDDKNGRHNNNDDGNNKDDKGNNSSALTPSNTNNNAGRTSLSSVDNVRRVSFYAHDAADHYDLMAFNTFLSHLVEILSLPRFLQIEGHYPAEDLNRQLVSLKSAMSEFQQKVKVTHERLQSVAHVLDAVCTALCDDLTKPREELAGGHAEDRSPEELTLLAEASEMRACVAQAHGRTAQACQLTTELESIAVQDRMAAQQAVATAERIREELELRKEQERRQEEEEERLRVEEDRKRKEEEERKAEEERHAEEELWKKQQDAHDHSELPQTESEIMMTWPIYVYPEELGSETAGEVHCLVRTNPDYYHRSDIICDVIPQRDVWMTYGEQEELISRIVSLRSASEGAAAAAVAGEEPLCPIYVALPCMGRLPPSREPVLKAFQDGNWEELVTTDFVFDQNREVKFAQARVDCFTKVYLVSRFKRDFLTIPLVKKGEHKATSSYDSRVALTFVKNSFEEEQRLVLQVQPVESNYVSEFRRLELRNKRLLTCSPILHIGWNHVDEFSKPVRIALPCPPNPAKARQMALARKQKETKMSSARLAAVVQVNPEDVFMSVKKKKAKVAAAAAAAATPRTAEQEAREEKDPPAASGVKNKWYMGLYGLTDDDENDSLNLMTYNFGKWSFAEHTHVKESRVDLVTFDLKEPCERLLVLRTVVDTEEEVLKHFTLGLLDRLNSRSVCIFVRQHHDDPYDVYCLAVPSWAEEKAEKTLDSEGYIQGAHQRPVHVSLQEGSALALCMKGNLHILEQEAEELPQLLFNSNLPTYVNFKVIEKDKYLQRNLDTFRGALQVHRNTAASQCFIPKRGRVKSLAPASLNEELTTIMARPDLLCAFYVDIPKDHIEAEPAPKRVSMTVRSDAVVNQVTLITLSEALGDEWQDLADKLQLDKVRMHSILKVVHEVSEEHAKYTMLMTWFKRCPQAADKVTILVNALQAAGRKDLSYLLLRGKKKSIAYSRFYLVGGRQPSILESSGLGVHV